MKRLRVVYGLSAYATVPRPLLKTIMARYPRCGVDARYNPMTFLVQLQENTKCQPFQTAPSPPPQKKGKTTSRRNSVHMPLYLVFDWAVRVVSTSIITGDRTRVVHRTYGTHKNLPGIYLTIFTHNMWSYLLWPPVIVAVVRRPIEQVKTLLLSFPDFINENISTCCKVILPSLMRIIWYQCAEWWCKLSCVLLTRVASRGVTGPYSWQGNTYRTRANGSSYNL